VAARLPPTWNGSRSTLAGIFAGDRASRTSARPPATKLDPPRSIVALSAAGLVSGKFVGAMASSPFGKMLADLSSLPPVLTYITAYLLTTVAIKLVFVMIRRMAGEKLVSGEMFGNFEYYLGMGAGLVRFACIVLFVLALLNAKQVSKAELQAQLKHQQDWAGSVYFPPFGSIQQAVFEESLSGRAVKQYLSAQLINVDSSAGGAPRENIGRRRDREIEEIMHPK